MTTMTDHPPHAFGFYDSATSPRQRGVVDTLSDFIDSVRSDEFKEQITNLRRMLADGDDDGYSVAKRTLPAVSISGHCDGLRSKAMEENRFTHSGYLQLDFDAADNFDWSVEEILEILKAEPRIVAAFISPSGHGVKGIARIPECKTREEHVAAFAAARNHFANSNLVIDEACKDPVRLMFVSHDPHAWCDLTRTAKFDAVQLELPATPTPTPSTPSTPSTGLVIKQRSHDFPQPPDHGIHTWTMEAAWWCRIHHLTEQEAVNRIQSYDGQLRRPLQPTEARDAASKVYTAEYKSKEEWTHEQDQKHATDLLARAYALQFDPSSPPPPDETCMQIDDIPICARGNLTVLQGKSKVGKSAVISAIIGAAVRGTRKANGDTLCINWQGESTGSILHLDTEQSRSDWFQLVVRGILRGGIPEYPQRLRSLPLIPFSRSERLDILRLALAKEQETFGQVDLVLLDGVADICSSPNDETEALELVSILMALAQDYHCPVVCVLHENPGSDIGKTRGHLGSELNRKAFANLRIDKDAETSISTIYGSDMRKRDIPREQGFSFGWSPDDNMHVFLGNQREVKSSAKQEQYRQEVIDLIHDASVPFSELTSRIARLKECQQRAAERWVTKYVAEGVLLKTSIGNYIVIK